MGGIETTFNYWIIYTISFFFGYYSIIGKRSNLTNKSKYIYFHSNSLGYVLAIIGLIGTIGSILNLGFVPILVEGAGEKRYFADMGFSRVWALNIPASVFLFSKYLKQKKRYDLFIFLIVISQNALFIVRYNFVFSSIACLILYATYKKISFRLILSGFLVLISFVIFNSLYLQQRSGQQGLLNKRGGGSLNAFQTNFLYKTFNEFRQLNVLINTYEDKLYGETFLAIPVSFFPTPFLNALGIDKQAIKQTNSAIILASETGAPGGLRTGLAGEFYINFGFWGALCMFIVGYILGYLDNIFHKLNPNDIRKIFVIIFQVILIYGSLIGQIDAIATSFAINILLLLILLIFTRKSRNLNIVSNYHNK
jgi:hypothetical protein